jgi:hypothetical protein
VIGFIGLYAPLSRKKAIHCAATPKPLDVRST